MRLRCLIALASLSAALALPAQALAHGGDEMEAQNMSEQPARTLAEQAMSELRVRNDTATAAEQLDAAVASKDQSDVDPKLVNDAMEALDAGHTAVAISTLDRALSQPLGEQSGAELHASGREFQPGTDTQEVVAIILGALLLILGGALLLRGRRARAASP